MRSTLHRLDALDACIHAGDAGGYLPLLEPDTEQPENDAGEDESEDRDIRGGQYLLRNADRHEKKC